MTRATLVEIRGGTRTTPFTHSGLCAAILAAAALVLLAAPRAVPASELETGLAKCGLIAASAARLACYDALAHRAGSTAAVAPAAPSAAAAPSARAAAAPAPTAPAAPQPGNVNDPKNFGLSLAQQHLAYAGVQSIEARVDVVSTDQNNETHVVLDNGQSWLLLENDGWVVQGQAVTIKRAALGSFMMVTPSHHSYRVRRLR